MSLLVSYTASLTVSAGKAVLSFKYPLSWKLFPVQLKGSFYRASQTPPPTRSIPHFSYKHAQANTYNFFSTEPLDLQCSFLVCLFT